MQNENDYQEMKVEVLKADEAAISLLTKAEIDTQISTAKAYPRSMKHFLEKTLSIATISEEVASSCAYALPRGDKTLEGPSVRLAEIAASSYGNLRAGARVIHNDGRVITAQGICHDLESNTCVTIEVKRKITDKKGRTYSEDMQVVTGNAACAIAFRNAVFKVIPSALISDIYDKVKEVATGNEQTLKVRRDKAIKYFTDLGVKDDRICGVLGIQHVDDIDLEKLRILRGMVTLIKNNESSIDELFPVVEKDKTGDALANAAMDAMKKADEKAKENQRRPARTVPPPTDNTAQQ